MGPPARGARLATIASRLVDLTSMPNGQHEDDQLRLSHFVENSPVSNSIGPSIGEQAGQPFSQLRMLRQPPERLFDPTLDGSVQPSDLVGGLLRVQEPKGHL